MFAPLRAALVLSLFLVGRAEAAPVLVTVVIDQLPAWSLDERLPLLPADGGFRRLLREGTYVREMRYAHAGTDTGPGHAALYTGAPPRDSGVVCNEQVEEGSARRISAFLDPSTHVLDGRGLPPSPSASLASVRAMTLGDRVAAARPAGVVAISLKDRGAIFAAGRKPRAAVWYDVGSDRVVTSSAFGPARPAWVERVVQGSALSGQLTWARRLPDTALPSGYVDDRPGEGSLGDDGVRFPHRVETAAQLRASPYGDQLVLKLAKAALDDGAPALLALSLSSNDYIGHVYGPDSVESLEELFALDRELASFQADLDRRFGPNGWAMMLTGDHGATPLPETPISARAWCKEGARDRWQRPCAPGVRIDANAVGVRLDAAATQLMGSPGWVAGVIDPYVQLSPKARKLAPAALARLVSELRKTLLGEPGIAAVYETARLPATCPGIEDESNEALICRAVAAPSRPIKERGGELYMLTTQGSYFDTQLAPRRGGSHGSPYLFDRSVPLLIRAPGRVAAGRVVEEPRPFSSFVRTAAALIGVDPPSSAAPGPSLVDPIPVGRTP